MKKITPFLLCAILICTACTDSSEPKPAARDTARKTETDSVSYNPATPAAQNSDDPSRFSQ